MELRQAKIPYVLMGGMSFYDRKEVRDVLAYLKVLAHPADEPSLMRIINVPPRGIGSTTVKRLMEEAVRQGKPLGAIIAKAGGADIPVCHSSVRSKGSQECPPHQESLPYAAVARFHALIERFRRQVAEKSPAEIVKTLVREVGYREELDRLYPDINERDARWASVEELVNAVAGYCQRASKPTLAGFLQDVALTSAEGDDDKESKLERNAVALMTLHAAKGLEFSEVYMVGMEEGILPHHRSVADGDGAVDEERRLCYVGVTRAQRRLTLTLPLNRRKWGKSRPTQPSRFLYELTGQAENPNYLAAKAGRAVGRPRTSRT
jgi:DNA helicase-2/ATP-dependent DNA helicase PcrA